MRIKKELIEKHHQSSFRRLKTILSCRRMASYPPTRIGRGACLLVLTVAVALAPFRLDSGSTRQFGSETGHFEIPRLSLPITLDPDVTMFSPLSPLSFEAGLGRRDLGRTPQGGRVAANFSPPLPPKTQQTNTSLSPAQRGCGGGCLNPHPGQFGSWYGPANGCWVQLWRQWADGCTHYQMYNTCGNYFDPQIHWTCCVH